MAKRDMSPIRLGRDAATGQLVALGAEARRDGLYLIGKTHQGKSALIEQMIIQDVEAGRGLCLLDPHGDLTDRVLAHLPSSRQADTTLLDLHDTERPFGLNLFSCPDPQNPTRVAETVSRVMEIFAKVWDVGPDTPRLGRVLRNVTATLAETGLTMAEIPDLLENEAYRVSIVGQVRNPQVRRFWQFFETIPRRDFPLWIESTLNRLDPFLANPLLYNIVGQQKNTVDWRQAMDSRDIVLVKLDPQLAEPTSILGATIVGQILDAAFSRTNLRPEQRTTFMLYADEYQRFATPAFATLLEQARKFGMATTLAHQRRSQLDNAHRAAPLGAVNLVVFSVLGEDAQELSNEFDATPPPPPQRRKALVTDPLRYIAQHGHDDPEVMRLYGEAERLFDNVLGWWRKAAGEIALLQELTHQRTSSYVWKKEEARAAEWILRTIPAQYHRFDIATRREQIYEIVRRYLYASMTTRSDGPSIGDLWDVIMNGTGEGRPHYAVMDPAEGEPGFPKPVERSELPDLENAHIELTKEVLYVIDDIAALLEEAPIETLVGAVDPLPPQTYADRRNHIANELATLPAHTAKVKISKDGKRQEHLIETIKPDDPPAGRSAFRPRPAGRPRVEVEAEIASRISQALPSDTTMPTLAEGLPPVTEESMKPRRRRIFE